MNKNKTRRSASGSPAGCPPGSSHPPHSGCGSHPGQRPAPGAPRSPERLDPEAVAASRAQYGSNKVTHEKRNLCPDGWPGHSSIPLPPFSSVWLWCPP